MTPVTGKYFPSQRSKEKVYLLLRRHWFTYVIFVIITLLMVTPLVVLLIYWFLNPESFGGIAVNFLILGVPAYSLSIIALLLYGFVDYYLDVYIITNQRVVDIKQDGFFKREIAELHLHQIQDVSAKVKGIFPTTMHYGDIYIQTAGEKENFYFKSIPHPYRVSKLIVNLHESHLEQRFKDFEGLIDEGGNKNKYEKKLDKIEKKAKSQKSEDLSELADVGSFSKRVFSQARKNTKKLLNDIKDGSRGDTNGINISEEITNEEKDIILEGINKDGDMAENEPSIDYKSLGNKSDDQGADTDESGEMNENEEIDI